MGKTAWCGRGGGCKTQWEGEKELRGRYTASLLGYSEEGEEGVRCRGRWKVRVGAGTPAGNDKVLRVGTVTAAMEYKDL